jgi:hypothetical protein
LIQQIAFVLENILAYMKPPSVSFLKDVEGILENL